MRSRRLLQLAGIALTSALLTTQGWARSETLKSPGALPANKEAARAPIQQRAVGANQLPLVIDGSKTPELISDSVAFGHFVRATLVPTESPDETETRQRGMLVPLQLSDADRDALLQTIRVVRENLDRIETQRRALRASDADVGATIRKLSDEQTELLESARKHLNRVLTFAGSSRLNAYLGSDVKRRIKAYADLQH